MTDCTHTDQIQDVDPQTDGCEECLAMDADWVHLRVCLICGHVGCCDSSPHKHATQHYEETGHALIQSFEPGGDWVWCYEDETTVPVDVPARSYT